MTIGKEIITIQLGMCGNTIGNSFWEDVCGEHGLTSTGIFSGCGNSHLMLEHIDCLFTDGATGQNYVPRCVLVDLDPSSLNACRCAPLGQLFRPDNFIFGTSGSGNNYARAFFTTGVDIRDPVLEAVRHEFEMCDYPAGFQILSSIGGGTGSGFGSLLLDQLKDEYSKMVITNYCVVPGGGSCSDAVVEPINATLACGGLVKNSDITVCMDNLVLYDICKETLKLDTPLNQDINEIIAKVISGFSSAYRFDSKNYLGWKSVQCFMVPSPKLHFFVPGFVPLNSRGVQPYRNFSTHDITYQMLLGDSFHANGVNRKYYAGGKYITACAIYRGYSVKELQVIKHLTIYEDNNESKFVPWMRNHFIKGICDIPPQGMKISATFMANHTGAQRHIWGNILKKYRALFKKKAFIHWYYAEGMGDDDFRQAEEQVIQLIQEYKCCEEFAPKDWKPMSDEQLFQKCMKEEQVEHFQDELKKHVSSLLKRDLCEVKSEIQVEKLGKFAASFELEEQNSFY